MSALVVGSGSPAAGLPGIVHCCWALRVAAWTSGCKSCRIAQLGEDNLDTRGKLRFGLHVDKLSCV
jgi:hypothetical protein